MQYTTSHDITIDMQPTPDGKGGVTVKHFPDELMFDPEESGIVHADLAVNGDNANGALHCTNAEAFYNFMREYTTC